MFRRRRTGLVLPPARRNEENPATGDSSAALTRGPNRGSAWRFRLRSSGPISYISSSDSTSSSRSVSPTSRSSGHPRTSQTTSEAAQTRGPSRSGTRTRRHERSRGSSSPDAPSRDAGGQVHRCPLVTHPKPLARSSRHTLLRSPIFRLILSPNSVNRPQEEEADSDQSASTVLADESDQTRARQNQNSVQHPTTGQSRVEGERPGRTRQSNRDADGLRSLIRRAQQHLHSPPVPATQDSNARQTAVNAVRSTRTTGHEDDDDCVICLDVKSNRSIILPCMHTFCYECIYRWLRINPSCPLCKRLANRIIHSILSDSEFTELPVSEIRPSDSPEFYPVAQYPFDEDRSPHHHFHYHLDAPSFGVLRYWGPAGPTPDPPRASVIIPPILIPSDSPGAAPVPTGDSSGRPTNLWNYNPGPSVESFRANLMSLVNGAVRPRDSSLLDGLLLRQMVYVFDFDSIPAPQQPNLERDISPDFLRTNEAQRHRLEAFVRRELRVLAPWLAYLGDQSNEQSSSSVLREERPRDEEADATNNPAVTAPLLSGAPGLLTETPELDAATARVVQHVTTVPMSNESGLLAVLCSLPRFGPPFVPLTYLTHLVTEITRFARYSGTLEQYDAAVCFYRRRNLRPISNTGSDPRMASYIGSACWPRMRPGFVQPQGLITHPLINWLLHRLFVHLVNGTSHPVRLHGTGDHPNLLPSPLNYSSSYSPPPRCHPHCLRLSNLSRSLLESLPSSSELRSTRETGSNSLHAPSFARGMTPNEMFPNRLLFQRVLSELIDQARFSEALSEHYSYHPNTAYVPGAHDQIALVPRPSQQANIIANHMNLLRGVLDAHSLALHRLNGIVQLFNTRGSSTLDVNDWVTDLLHTPLLPSLSPDSPAVARPSVVIDLTGTRPRDTPRNDALGADWNFLTQSPWNVVLWNNDLFPDSSNRPPRSLDEVIHPREARPSPAELGWRNQAASCVIISSDSSEDELGENTEAASSHGLLTADDDEENGRSAINNAAESEALCSNPAGLNEIEATASNLSLFPTTSGGGAEDSNRPRDRQISPEPMDVDNISATALKRPANLEHSAESVDPPSPSPSRPAKLAKVDSIFADIIRRLRGSSPAPVESQTIQREAGRNVITHRSRHHHTRRHRHSRTRSPIRVDSSGSDCELVHEYIRVDSPSPSLSSCSSESTTSCSNSTPTSPHLDQTRSKVTVRSAHMRRHYTCRKYCSCRPHWHHRCSYCICRRRHAKCVHRHCHARHHSRYYSQSCRRLITVNSKTSPILISDDEDSDAQQPDRVVANTSQTTEAPPSSTSTFNQNCAVKLEFDPTPGPSTSYTPTRAEVSIFEPTSLDDFYRFLERFLPVSGLNPPSLRGPSVTDSTGLNGVREKDDHDSAPTVSAQVLANAEEDVHVEVTDHEPSDRGDESPTDHLEQHS